MKNKEEAIKEFNRCVNALALELPGAVWDDVHFRWIELQNAIKPSHAEAVKDEWVAVEDGLPEDTNTVWCYDGHKQFEARRYNMNVDYFVVVKNDGDGDGDYDATETVTHWQPLPKAPLK